MKRRSFLASATLFATCPSWAGWAAAGAPAFITAANQPDRSTWLVGLRLDGSLSFRIPLPSRGHAAAPHPTRAEAIAFARRPGRFAVVMDCISGTEITRITSPKGRHFYGHGAYSADGSLLFTTENDYDELTGVIGIYDANHQYRRLGELPSGGIGPHEILRRPDGGFVLANGGIQTHPDMARSKLNLPTMTPSLVYLDPEGQIEEQVFLPEDQHQNSIRHIDIGADGSVIIALQWQGNPLAEVPLVAHHQRGGEITLLRHPDEKQLKNYAGSIAYMSGGDSGNSGFAVTGPKGSVVLFFDADGQANGARSLGTAAGLARTANGGLVISCEGGLLHHRPDGAAFIPVAGDWAWDNHLAAV